MTHACYEAGVSTAGAYKLRKNNPKFAQDWEDAQEIGLNSLEDVANERARGDSDVLLMFLLKAHRPEKYRDNFKGGGANLTTEQVVGLLTAFNQQLEEDTDDTIKSDGSEPA